MIEGKYPVEFFQGDCYCYQVGYTIIHGEQSGGRGEAVSKRSKHLSGGKTQAFLARPSASGAFSRLKEDMLEAESGFGWGVCAVVGRSG